MISLSENETETMRILWERGESKPGEIQELFSWPIDNGTLRSTLMNLVRKKHVAREQRGKAFYYTASVPKTTALKTMMRSLAGVFAGGSTRELVAQLVETQELTPDDLKLLRQVATTKQAGQKKEFRA